MERSFRWIINHRMLLTSFFSSICHFLLYLISPYPGDNRFTIMFPQQEVAGVFFVAIICFWGLIYDRFRSQGKDDEDWYWGYNEYIVLLGIHLFFLLPFVGSVYLGVLDEHTLCLIFKYSAVVAFFVLPVCIYCLRSYLYTFALNVLPLKIGFKWGIRNLSFSFIAIPWFPFCVYYTFINNKHEGNESVHVGIMFLIVMTHLFIGYISIFLLRYSARNKHQ